MRPTGGNQIVKIDRASSFFSDPSNEKLYKAVILRRVRDRELQRAAQRGKVLCWSQLRNACDKRLRDAIARLQPEVDVRRRALRNAVNLGIDEPCSAHEFTERLHQRLREIRMRKRTGRFQLRLSLTRMGASKGARRQSTPSPIVMESYKTGSAHQMTRLLESGFLHLSLRRPPLRSPAVTHGQSARLSLWRSSGGRCASSAKARLGRCTHSLSRCCTAFRIITRRSLRTTSFSFDFFDVWKKLCSPHTTCKTSAF
jgi:hypothetical protein